MEDQKDMEVWSDDGRYRLLYHAVPGGRCRCDLFLDGRPVSTINLHEDTMDEDLLARLAKVVFVTAKTMF